jgi:ferredoxin
VGTLHVYVDDEQCFGYQRCVQIAPNTFSLNEAGNSVAGPPADDEEAIREAAWACPMQAIVVTDDPTRSSRSSTVRMRAGNHAVGGLQAAGLAPHEE